MARVALGAAAVALLAAAAATLPKGAQALDFEMTTQTKCVYEEINAGALVVGDYSVVHREKPTQAVYADVRVSCFLGICRFCSVAPSSFSLSFHLTWNALFSLPPSSSSTHTINR
jgi:hypothetical protein